MLKIYTFLSVFSGTLNFYENGNELGTSVVADPKFIGYQWINNLTSVKLGNPFGTFGYTHTPRFTVELHGIDMDSVQVAKHFEKAKVVFVD